MTRASLGVAFRAGGAKAGQFMASRPDWALERLATLPTTNFRIFFTIMVFGATAWRYLTATDGWSPSLEWCGMLLGMAGIDVAQFLSKRRTHPEYIRAQNGYAHEPPEGSARADEF